VNVGYYQYILLDENSDRRKNKRAIKKAGTRPAVDREAVNLREKDHICNIPYLGKYYRTNMEDFVNERLIKCARLSFVFGMK
jgi:hypothetical protein